MASRDDGGPAYPALKYEDIEAGESLGEYASEQGMTLLDFFAANALKGALSDSANVRAIKDYAAENDMQEQDAMASICYEYAEAFVDEKRRREAK